MLCQICKKNPATIQLQELNAAGEKKVIMLCTECAMKKNVDSSLPKGMPPMQDILRNLASELQKVVSGALGKNADSDNEQQIILTGEIPFFGNGSPEKKGSGSHGKQTDEVNEVKCGCCGWTESELKKTGKLGCPVCADVFKKQFEDMLFSCQCGLTHTGMRLPEMKNPTQKDIVFLSKTEEEFYWKRQIVKYKKGLREAVAREEYGQAAQLRDKIRELEGKMREENSK